MAALDAEQIEQLLAMAGIDPTALGGDTAEINHLLDALPAQATDRIFRVVLDKLTR